MNAAYDFVRHALETPFSAIPAPAIIAAQTFILDTIGVGIAGSKAPLADIVLKTARGWGEAGATGASAWGSGVRLPVPSAAFVNGFQIHCQEFDCVHEAAVVHPMATILAALMAEAEGQGDVSGADFVAAVIVAVDVAAGLGVAVTSPIRFFRPANAGLFGATLGIARLRGFDEFRALNALGYALAHCSGTMQAHVEGKPALPIQIGNAARAAVLACDLAGAGIEGPHDIFEGPFGYFPLFEEAWDLQPVVASLGKTWRICEVSHKPFPTGRAAHGGIAAVQQLRAQGVSATNLVRLDLTAPPIIKRLVGRPVRTDMPVNYARLCFGFSGAVALADGTVGLDAFAPSRLADRTLISLGEKFTIIDDGSSDPAAFVPQTGEAVLDDGSVRRVTIDHLPGSPAAALPRAEQLAKFQACLEFATLDGIRAPLIELIDGLETQTSVRRLAGLVAGSR